MSETYDLEGLLRQAYAAETSRLPAGHPQRTPDCPHPSFYVRYARTGWPQELAAHAAICAYCQKSMAVWSSDTAPEQHLLDIPEEIRNAARLLAKTTAEFLETLIGFSAVPSAVPSAAGTLVLSAELNRYRGGTVSLDLDSSGHGVLRAWFDYPDRITVSLLDTTNGSLIPLSTEDIKDLQRLSIPAGNSLRNVGVSCSPQVFRALRIIVQKGENKV
jgi:hypothetical protein